jgi:hypothetical protein
VFPASCTLLVGTSFATDHVIACSFRLVHLTVDVVVGKNGGSGEEVLVQVPCVFGRIHDSMLGFPVTLALLAFLPRSAPRSSASFSPATASTTDPASRYGRLASVQKIAIVLLALTCSHLVLYFQKPRVLRADAFGQFCNSLHGSLASVPKDGLPMCDIRLRIELLN